MFADWSTPGDPAIQNLESGEYRRLTNTEAYSANASSISPDGQHIAYAWRNSARAYDLRLIGIDGSNPRVIYSNNDVNVFPSEWSRNGRQILALLDTKDGSHQIALVSVGEGAIRVLKALDSRQPTTLTFSPDDRFVVYDLAASKTAPERDLFLLTVESGSVVPLVEGPADDFVLGWAPDGTRVLFGRLRGGTVDAWAVRVASGKRQGSPVLVREDLGQIRRDHHPAIDRAPIWTPDGTRIVFLSDRRGADGVWTIPVADGRPQGIPELLKADIGAMSPLGFSRDGSLFYGVRTDTEDIYVADLNPQTTEASTAPARLTDRFLGSNLAGAWSPDGTKFAYFSRRKSDMSFATGLGRMPVVIRSIDTGEEREFFTNLEFNIHFPTLDWFPDGRSLLLTATNAQRREGLHRMDAQTGVVTPIRESLSSTWFEFSTLFPRVSPDGRTVYCSRRGEGEPASIRAYEIDTGRERELWRSASSSVAPDVGLLVRSMALSRDGKRLAFFTAADGERRSLHVMSTDGGAAPEIFRPEDNHNAASILADIEWTHDDRFILFVTTDPNADLAHVGEPKNHLWRISPDGGAPQTVVSMEELLFPSVSHDGRRLAFTAGTKFRWEVWVMQNFLPALKTAVK